jgi:hypothetical protein
VERLTLPVRDSLVGLVSKFILPTWGRDLKDIPDVAPGETSFLNELPFFNFNPVEYFLIPKPLLGSGSAFVDGAYICILSLTMILSHLSLIIYSFFNSIYAYMSLTRSSTRASTT